MKIECEKWNIGIIWSRVHCGIGWWKIKGKVCWKWFHCVHNYYDGDWYALRIGPFFFSIYPSSLEDDERFVRNNK